MYKLLPDSVTVRLQHSILVTTLCYGAVTNFGFIAQGFF